MTCVCLSSSRQVQGPVHKSEGHRHTFSEIFALLGVLKFNVITRVRYSTCSLQSVSNFLLILGQSTCFRDCESQLPHSWTSSTLFSESLETHNVESSTHAIKGNWKFVILLMYHAFSKRHNVHLCSIGLPAKHLIMYNTSWPSAGCWVSPLVSYMPPPSWHSWWGHSQTQ